MFGFWNSLPQTQTRSGRLPDMPKRKEPELDPKEQIKRFKKAAKEAGATDDEGAFRRAIKKIARAKPVRKPSVSK